ncbi:MAG: hypothetical protein FWG51_05640, partial [Firmicutes bacterium]|nr:hypothetical protein [Bacillota bacterium]
GWSKNAGTYDAFDFSKTITEDVTVYAIWRELTAEEVFNNVLDKMAQQSYINVVMNVLMYMSEPQPAKQQDYVNTDVINSDTIMAFVFEKGIMVSLYEKDITDESIYEKWANKDGIFVKEAGRYYKESSDVLELLSLDIKTMFTSLDASFRFGDNKNTIVLEFSYDDYDGTIVTAIIENGLIKTMTQDVDGEQDSTDFTYTKNNAYYAPDGWEVTAKTVFEDAIKKMSQQDYLNVFMYNGELETLEVYVFEKGKMVSAYYKDTEKEQWLNEDGLFVNKADEYYKTIFIDKSILDYSPSYLFFEGAIPSYFSFSFGETNNIIYLDDSYDVNAKITIENGLIIDVETQGYAMDVAFTYEKDNDFYVPQGLDWEEKIPLSLELEVSEFVKEATYFSFTPDESGLYRFYSFDNNNCDPYGYLYDEEFNIIAFNDDGGIGPNFFILINLEGGRTYYLYASTYRGQNFQGGSYSIVVVSFEFRALELETPELVTEETYFSFSPEESGYYRLYSFDIANSSLFADYVSCYPAVNLYDENFNIFGVKNGDGINFFIIVYLQAGQTYYLHAFVNDWAYSEDGWTYKVAVEKFVPRVLNLDTPELVAEETFFSFTPEESGYYRFYSFNNLDCYPNGNLYNENFFIVGNNIGGVNFSIKAYLEAGRIYYLNAKVFNEEFGEGYKITVQKFVEEELNLETPAFVEKDIYFSFTPEESGYYRFYSFDNMSCNPYGELYDENYHNIVRNVNDGTLNFSIIIFLESGKTYYLHAYASSQNFDGGYKVAVEKFVAEVLNLETPAIVEEETYFSFTPEESGYYRFYSFDISSSSLIVGFGSCSPVGNLYNEHFINIGNNSGDINYFSIVVYLQAGKTYMLHAFVNELTYYEDGWAYKVAVEKFVPRVLNLETPELVAEETYFSFTPEESGYYRFYSFNNLDCYPEGNLYN